MYSSSTLITTPPQFTIMANNFYFAPIPVYDSFHDYTTYIIRYFAVVLHSKWFIIDIVVPYSSLAIVYYRRRCRHHRRLVVFKIITHLGPHCTY